MPAAMSLPRSTGTLAAAIGALVAVVAVVLVVASGGTAVPAPNPRPGADAPREMIVQVRHGESVSAVRAT